MAKTRTSAEPRVGGGPIPPGDHGPTPIIRPPPPAAPPRGRRGGRRAGPRDPWQTDPLPSLVRAGVTMACLAVAGNGIAQDAPCASCVAVAMAPGQVRALPGALNGLNVLLRVNGGMEGSAVPALDAVASRGGRPGLLVRGVPAEPLAEAAVRHSDVLVIDAEGSDISDSVVFSLKRQVTAARGAHPGVTGGLAGRRTTIAP